MPSGWKKPASAGRSISSRTTTAATCSSTFKTFRNAPTGSPLQLQGHAREPEGQFEYDAMHDSLPAVSWIIPTSTQSEHPDYMPAAGAAFVASKLDAIAANPEVWAKTVFILNYDENDGLFDHVPPPVAARRHAAGIRRRLADRRRLPRAVHHRLALDGRRLGLQPAVRSHLGAAVPGEIHRRARAQHHRLAPQDASAT